MKKILVVLTLFLFAGCSQNSYQDITAKEAKEKMNEPGFLILDVRSSLEFSKRRIDNSVNLALEDLEKNIMDLVPNKDRKIIVYCESGRRSKLASEKLVELGYKNIYNLVGGIQSFEEETK